MYTLCFTRYALEISNFCERVREYKWDSLRVNWMAYNISVVLTAGDCTRQLRVNVIGYTLLAQCLHMLLIDN